MLLLFTLVHLLVRADDILFLGVLSTTVVAFNAIDPLAATLLIPQALWVAYNTWINFQLCELNPKVGLMQQVRLPVQCLLPAKSLRIHA